MKKKEKSAGTIADELKELDLTNLTVRDLDENKMIVDFPVEKDLANLIYRTVNEVDYLKPIIDLNTNGKCSLTAAQLDMVEQLVSKTYTLPLQLAICDRITKARTPIM